MKKVKNGGSKPSRRDFLISLASGSAAIVGYFLIPDNHHLASSLQVPSSEYPCLANEAIFNFEKGMLTLGRGETKLVCSVNEMGAQIIKHLDGKHSVADIARSITESQKLEHTDKMEARIAFFLAETGSVGFLQKPYFAQIIERYPA